MATLVARWNSLAQGVRHSPSLEAEKQAPETEASLEGLPTSSDGKDLGAWRVHRPNPKSTEGPWQCRGCMGWGEWAETPSQGQFGARDLRGIIEEWGSGTLRMAEAVGAAGLPSLEIEDDGADVIVRFRHGFSAHEVRLEDSIHPTEMLTVNPGHGRSLEPQEAILALLDGAEGGHGEAGYPLRVGYRRQ